MALLRVEDVSRSLGGRVVLEQVSFAVGQGRKVALVGANGTGKTTLLRVVAGLEEPDAGRVTVAGGARAVMVAQEPAFDGGGTVLEAVRATFTEIVGLERRLRELERAMAERADPGVLDAYARAQARYEAAGGYELEHRVRAALRGLGFAEGDLALPVAALSGGQRSRAALAQALVQEPDLLLLDEPTNHLDLDALEWLEDTLRRFRGAVLVVSHDRHFLDRVAGTVLELEDGRVTEYAGNYLAYEAARAARAEQARDAARRHGEEVERLEAFVRKWKAGTRSRQAKSREKMLERLARSAPAAAPKTVTPPKVAFAPGARSGRRVLEVEGLAKRYGDRVLFRDLSFRVERGERVGVVGPNGVGKTTLLRVLLGHEPATEGRVAWGPGVVPAYFAQSEETPDNGITVLEACLEAGEAAGREMTLLGARSWLARFGLRGEAVFQPVETLSGGERARLALARLVLLGANLLLLDEPTNHLDIPARRALEDALLAFEGTVILVSHDRRLLDVICTHILALEAGAAAAGAPGAANWFAGNYSAWRAARESAGAPAEAETETGTTQAGKGKQRGRSDRSRMGQSDVASELAALEGEITALEARRAELSGVLADPATYAGGRGGGVVREYREVEGRLEACYRRWEELSGPGNGSP